MSNTLFIDNAYYRLTNDTDAIRQLDVYQKIRDEINRRFNPLAGGTDWEIVRESCDALAKSAGLDLLMCGYFAVANLKTLGLAGYANGLELLSVSLSNQSQPDVKTAKMRKEVLDWVNARVVQELKDLKPNYESLRDLYRCERFCERIHHQLERQQPEYLVDFEGVGFVLFEHIDRIETQYHSLVKRQHQQAGDAEPQVLRRIHRTRLSLAFVAGCVLSVGAAWGYQVIPWFHTSDYATRVEVATLSSDDARRHFQQSVSDNQIARWKSDLVPLYEQSIGQKSAISMEQSKREAMHEMATLRTLYPDDEQIKTSDEAFSAAQRAALEQTELFVQRFGEIRTKMANISLLAKREKWRDLQRQTKSLEDFAVSLSPVYGRVDYVQNLIKQGELESARKELEILKNRLNNLSWTMAQLEESLSGQPIAQ
ncbi:type VI secretion system ImpA family N-terminal domain-containing protein [Vibrio furnissii]|uniref:type VI secretion system ImpA family N-terminal domain-containing protein n=1 Tax=Vibrio furnissii TaxID=29494 RepID=UPI001EECC4CA|nr:type VI secretion system ImpA family N-terminal domain-containing protein [Vibrio furnissii]